ncbi:ABC transporter substrate-binding protein [Marinitenerispora sediminis]|nr:ABC transporter substrate-binding protein [Marinitenerispora sediminis]RCV52611.1 ABC transporter substrate-binding protein [Marinitenerispora sediminis]
MQNLLRPGWRAAIAAAGAGVLLAATACGGGSGEADGEVTLVVDTFGVFGYEELYQRFEEENPGVTIEERNITDLADYTPQLQQNIAAGSGAGDVVAVEEGILVQFLQQADRFVDLNEHGGAELEANFLPWKWEQGHTTDGRLIGLGTDIGSMAMCYNVELFRDAGLPTDREEVGELWPTWEDFIETGQQFQEADTGASFVSTIFPYFNVLKAQEGDHTYQNTEGELVIETNPAVRGSWETVTSMAEAGLSANLPLWSDEWNAGIQNNTFATLPCPAWMLGHIESTAGDAGNGRWDVAAVPGGGGNWGGSFLSVPTQSEHPELAAELAILLSSPEGQLAAWNAANNLPSSEEAIDSADVQEFTRPYFNDAPVGQIYGASARELEPVYFGPDNQAIDDAFRAALESVEQGQASPDEGWQRAAEEAERAAGEG